MKTIFAYEKSSNDNIESIFLAGPTPRSENILSWRPAALYYLSYEGFKGEVFVPEPLPGHGWSSDYIEQIEWEEEHLKKATKIMFWIPRMEKMPGFTTNIEFGRWCNSRKIVVGWPEDAMKMNYIEYYINKLGIPSARTLFDTVRITLNYL